MSQTVAAPRKVFPYRWSAVRQKKTPAAPPLSWWRWPVLFLLAGCLIFCHGCHAGDHDDELAIFLVDRE